MIDEILNERKNIAPDTGFVVAGIDEFEQIGNKLYEIQKFDDIRKAEEFQKTLDVDSVIIGSDE